jgi:multidrug resistance efflux pump
MKRLATRLLLPALAVLSLGFALVNVVRSQQTLPPASPPIAPASSPYGDALAGAGMVEPASEDIAVSPHRAGVVAEVRVAVGQKVAAGDLLLRMDDRAQQAELTVRQARLAAAEAELDKLADMPRPEELAPREAAAREAQARLVEAEDHLARVERLVRDRVYTASDAVTARQQYQAAREAVSRTQAEADLVRAGAWEPDVALARAAVDEARALLEQARTDLALLEVRAPVAGEVLQVNVRAGEFLAAPPPEASLVLGDVARLHVRVDIDERDITRFRPGLPARAVPRGATDRDYPLEFVRVEPYVVPKRSLTGDNTERVDTRILQVVYRLPVGAPVYVGQQVDVFLDLSGGDVAQ